jgi:UV DNA damage endonuclease
MRIGYPCQNLTVGCTSGGTFRLASYSATRLEETVAANLACLGTILRFNAEEGILFFRITSDLVPFASHPVCRARWRRRFAGELAALGRFMRGRRMRATMHPDQFTLINSMDAGIFGRSARELAYHAEVLDLMGLGPDAKIQIHVGGAYGDKAAAIRRFAARFRRLSPDVRRRLAVENDDRIFTLADCLAIHAETGAPVVFDAFHHRLNPSGESPAEAVALAARTWRHADGPPMVDYSEQRRGARRGSHADSISIARFKRFLAETRPHDFDLMLEIKDKERSAIRAICAARGDARLVKR